MAKMITDKQKPVETKLAGMKESVTEAQSSHANVEKNHAAQVQQLTKTIEAQGNTAKTKTEEAKKLGDELVKEESRLKELKATYDKLKTAAAAKGTKPAAK